MEEKTIISIVVGGVLVSFILLALVVRLVAALVARKKALDHAKRARLHARMGGHDGVHPKRLTAAVTAAKGRALAAQHKLSKTSDSPMVALLVAALQTAAALGDLTAVQQTAPGLGTLANAMDFTSLKFPLPWSTGPSTFCPQFCGTPDCNESAALHSYGLDAHCR